MSQGRGATVTVLFAIVVFPTDLKHAILPKTHMLANKIARDPDGCGSTDKVHVPSKFRIVHI